MINVRRELEEKMKQHKMKVKSNDAVLIQQAKDSHMTISDFITWVKQLKDEEEARKAEEADKEDQNNEEENK